jgi:hypothetical protein
MLEEVNPATAVMDRSRWIAGLLAAIKTTDGELIMLCIGRLLTVWHDCVA